MSFIVGAICAMCGGGVHDDRGRVACNGCDLPTDLCLCPERSVSSSRRRASAGGSVSSTVAGPRLACQILEEGCRPAPFAAADTAMPASSLVDARVILADSVSLYADAVRKLGQQIDPAALPNLLPPDERCFVEMRALEGEVPGWGAYLATLDLREPRVLDKVRADPALGLATRAAAAGARWLVLGGLVVADADGSAVGPVLLFQLCLDELGALVAVTHDAPALSVSMPRLLPGASDGSLEVFKQRCTRRYLVPIALALAFLNCEGAVLEPVASARTEPDRGFERLRIEPFEEVLAGASGPAASPVDAVLSIVPGRFQDDRGRAPGAGRGVRWCPEARHPVPV
jgi:hypothetical protein